MTNKNEKIASVKIKPQREMFYNSESGFGIYSCVLADWEESTEIQHNQYGNFIIKGTTMRLTKDMEYTTTIKEVNDKKYGLGYEIIKPPQEDVPTDLSKQRNYLACILTERQVEEIYKAYPDKDIIELIKTDQLDISKIHGVGKKTYEKIKDKIIESMEFQAAFDYLSKFDVTNNLIIKLVKHFKSASLLIQKMQENPYSITVVRGVGFKKADAIAMSMGYDKNGEYRILSCIEYVLEEQETEGHTWCSIDKLIDIVYELILVDKKLITEQVKNTGRVTVFDESKRVAMLRNYMHEKNSAEKLIKIMNNASELEVDIEKFIGQQENKHGMKLTDEQKQFFVNIKKNNVNVLTAAAGTGKSCVQKILIELLEQLNISYKPISPTGKASSVLSGYIKRPATTIHKAIGLGLEGGNLVDIEEQFIIVDETSMVGARLLDYLLICCKHKDVRILFIGDDSQIPSVDCGNSLYDLINSKVLPVSRFTKVFRQQEGGILDVATKIRKGQKFVDSSFEGIKEFGSDCILAAVPQHKMEGGYKYYFKEMLKGYNSDDIMLVSPTKKGNLGTFSINEEIQCIVNPKSDRKQEIVYGFNKIIFREGDIVINTKNSYKIVDCNDNYVSIMNGDIGKIIKINKKDEEIVIDFGHSKVPLDFNKLGQLLHAWCLTLHKCQGSASKVIIAVMDRSHKFQLNRNLIYTAITRASDKLIMLSQSETINFSMKKIANLTRNTFLRELLIGEVNKE